MVLYRFEDKEVQNDMKLVPYKIVNKDGKPYIEVQIKDGETKVFSPEEISAMVLTKMKETAESYLGKKIMDAVVTVPGKLTIQKFIYSGLIDVVGFISVFCRVQLTSTTHRGRPLKMLA